MIYHDIRGRLWLAGVNDSSVDPIKEGRCDWLIYRARASHFKRLPRLQAGDRRHHMSISCRFDVHVQDKTRWLWRENEKYNIFIYIGQWEILCIYKINEKLLVFEFVWRKGSPGWFHFLELATGGGPFFFSKGGLTCCQGGGHFDLLWGLAINLFMGIPHEYFHRI